jgi:hypothetical protein
MSVLVNVTENWRASETYIHHHRHRYHADWQAEPILVFGQKFSVETQLEIS